MKTLATIDSKRRLCLGRYLDYLGLDNNTEDQRKLYLFYPYNISYDHKDLDHDSLVEHTSRSSSEKGNRFFIFFYNNLEEELRSLYQNPLSLNQFRYITSSIFEVLVDNQNRILLPKIIRLTRSKEVWIQKRKIGLEVIILD